MDPVLLVTPNGAAVGVCALHVDATCLTRLRPGTGPARWSHQWTVDEVERLVQEKVLAVSARSNDQLRESFEALQCALRSWAVAERGTWGLVLIATPIVLIAPMHQRLGTRRHSPCSVSAYAPHSLWHSADGRAG